MKQLMLFLSVFFLFTSFTARMSADNIEVLYDSKPIGKEGIKLENGKNIQVINNSGGKIYKVEVFMSMGKRPCYQHVYTNAEAAMPISVAPFMSAACADARTMMLKVNVSTYITIPILK